MLTYGAYTPAIHVNVTVPVGIRITIPFPRDFHSEFLSEKRGNPGHGTDSDSDIRPPSQSPVICTPIYGSYTAAMD